jgi:hypothetical protein
LSNTGTAALVVSAIKAGGNFLERTDCGTGLLPGQHCNLTVIFRPPSFGSFAGMLTITDNAPNSPQIVTLSGKGTALSVSPSSLEFGNQTDRTTSSPLTVTLTNHLTSSAIAISNIGIHGANSASFAETNSCGASLAAGASCTITVDFTPQGKGKKSSTLFIPNNGGNNPWEVLLHGTGD